jgi:hypothetical protein
MPIPTLPTPTLPISRMPAPAMPAPLPTLWLTLLLAAASSALAADFTVEAAGAPPQELSPAVRSVLAETGVRAVVGATDLTVWLRREPPLAETPSSAMGLAFKSLKQGELVGALQVAAPWSDYRGRTVPPGLYTLRTALRPEDGYHMGVSEYRDFLLLLPAAEDTDPGRPWTYDEMVELSRRSSTSSHPAVLALFPVGTVETPTATENSWGQPTLALPFGELALGLVVEGVGEG